MNTRNPIARGFIKSNGNRLVGTFDVGGGPRHFYINVKLLGQGVECSKATLTYTNIESLVGECRCQGSIGKDNLRMNMGEGVVITGPLDMVRMSSVIIRGAGTWKTGAETSLDSASSANRQKENGEDPCDPPAPNPLNAPGDIRKLAREAELLKSGAPIIAIFGQSGTGKSTFINHITSEQQKVGKSLQSCTSDISVIAAKVGGKQVVVIDTPGIDDTRAGLTEADVLAGIASRLEAMGENRVWVTGVLFLHRISDNKFSQTASRISNMLKCLCGDAAMSHLMLCTTMWDKVSQDEGYDRLEELSETAWNEMISMGASTDMISSISANAKGEAERIVSELIKNASPVELAIQDEMVNQGKTVAETGAGQILTEYLREARAAATREAEKRYENILQESAAAEAKAKEALLAQEHEVERLRKQTEQLAFELKAQTERFRQEREKADREMQTIRANTREEIASSAAKAAEAISLQELKVNELRTRAEAMDGELQAQKARLQQEQDKAKREIEELRESMRSESEANAARMAEEMRAREREAVEATRALQAQVEQLRREQEEAERQIMKLRENIRPGDEARAANQEEEARIAHERQAADRNRLEGEMTRRLQDLQQQQKAANDKMTALRKDVLRPAENSAAKVEATRKEHEAAAEKLKRQEDKLHERSKWRWWFNPLNIMKALSGRV